jgi:phosphoribosylformylglycinamidine synthase
VSERVPAAVHDCADGGLAVALAEMAIAGRCGFRVTSPAPALGAVPAWFSESASRVVVAVGTDRVAGVVDRARAAAVPVTELGDAGGDRLIAEDAFDVPLAEAIAVWRDAIPAALSPATAE